MTREPSFFNCTRSLPDPLWLEVIQRLAYVCLRLSALTARGKGLGDREPGKRCVGGESRLFQLIDNARRGRQPLGIALEPDLSEGGQQRQWPAGRTIAVGRRQCFSSKCSRVAKTALRIRDLGSRRCDGGEQALVLTLSLELLCPA